jgi:hypothetical protein
MLSTCWIRKWHVVDYKERGGGKGERGKGGRGKEYIT